MLGVSQKLSMLVQKVSAVANVALLSANGMTQLIVSIKRIYIKYFMQFRILAGPLCATFRLTVPAVLRQGLHNGITVAHRLQLTRKLTHQTVPLLAPKTPLRCSSDEDRL